jgi:hypothetical protein
MSTKTRSDRAANAVSRCLAMLRLQPCNVSEETVAARELDAARVGKRRRKPIGMTF